ncbi:MAG: nuclear transport factor 2 family protein, partial [Gemmatimonadaceae bacterium]|nr:nuclear transport factor 2 family protein [Gemmatimonadaceae bacterium]
MSRPICWLALVLAAGQGCATHPHAAAGGTSTRTRPDSIAAAAALTVLKEREWPRAYAEQDTALLQRLLAPSFRRVDADGTVSTRDDELAYVRSTRPSYDSLRFRITRLDVFANGT